VSVFDAVDDQTWVRHTFPLVCKEWAELYRSQDASPLHETLELDFSKESQVRLGSENRLAALLTDRWPVVHGSRVISWAERRAGSVRKLHIQGGFDVAPEDLSPDDLGALVAVAGPSLTEILIDFEFNEQDVAPFWESLRDSVVTHRRLRSLVARGDFADVSESAVEPLGQLAGSLEQLLLQTRYYDDPEVSPEGAKLTRFPASLCTLTELRRLFLIGHPRITAIPAQISSLKKLEELDLRYCGLSSLPKELGELSGLEYLDLHGNTNLGSAPQDEAYPAELGKLKSLRYLELSDCGLRAVPAFLGELESLEILHLSRNDKQIYATLDILIKGCPRLSEVTLERPKTPESRAHIEGFVRKLLAGNPNAVVIFDEAESEAESE
jgi:hypothetical protein